MAVQSTKSQNLTLLNRSAGSTLQEPRTVSQYTQRLDAKSLQERVSVHRRDQRPSLQEEGTPE